MSAGVILGFVPPRRRSSRPERLRMRVRVNVSAVQGTRGLQTLLKELSRRTFDNFSCQACGATLDKDSQWFDHICQNHPNVVNNFSCEEIISGLKEANVDVIFSC